MYGVGHRRNLGLRKKSSENGLLICISDADVLVKLSKTGNLHLLNQAFPQVFIGPIVEREALRKIGTHGKGISLSQAKTEGWIQVVEIVRLSPEQKLNIKVFTQTYEPFLDPGELESAAIAHELGIPLMLSDDRTAKRYIEEYTAVRGLAHWEILSLLIKRGELSPQEAQQVFTSINETRSRPIKISFNDLHQTAIKRIIGLGL